MMGTTTYLRISGIVFGLVALLHLLRLFYGWQVWISDVVVPVWLSWVGFAFAGALSAWAFRLTGKP
jgi:hypothetical protein